MPKELDEIEDMEPDSSTGAEDVVSEAVDQTEEAAPAESSAATDETEVDTLSLVRDVVGKEEPAEAAPSAEGSEETGEGADETPKEPDDEDYSDVSFHKHPRFQQLIRQRNELKGDAVEYRKITAFIDQNGMTAEEAANGISIMALAKLNPTEAWKQIKPWVHKVAIAAGEILPEDLQQRVAKNELSREAAQEMSRLRAGVEASKVQQQFAEQRGQRQQQVDQGAALRDTAVAWENDRQLKDPNFAAKSPRIQREIAFLHATEGKPTDVAGVKDQLKRAYDAVNKEFAPPAAARPSKKPITPVRGGQVAGNARPEPTSTLDIIRAHRQRA